MTRLTEPGQAGAEHLFQGSPVNATHVENFPRVAINADSATALTTQVMTSVALPLKAGDTVTNLSFISGATAAGTPTNWWFALYSPAGALLSQSADQLTAAWAADTVKTLALGTPQVAAASAVYYAAIMVKATTVPSLLGLNLVRAGASTGVTGQKVLSQTSGAALTTTAPGTIATPTTVALMPYCVAT